MLNRFLFGLLVFVVLAFLGGAYFQYEQLPLDGDLAVIVLPSDWYAPVLRDPFGWAVLTQNAVYAAPNRYFAHLLLSSYFKAVPLWLHRVTDPIQSVYSAAALFQVAVQALLLYVLAAYCSHTGNLRRRGPWLVMVLLLPLFQTVGYNVQMGIIDHAVTYVCFYALPMALLLLLLLPFYRAAQRGRWRRLSWPGLLAYLALTVVLAFNGPIVTGVVAVLLPGILLYWARQRRTGTLPCRPHWQPVLLLSVLGALCLYSLCIGRNNSENLTSLLPLAARYKLLPVGFYKQLTSKLGLPLLLLLVLLNAQLIRRVAPPTVQGRHLLTTLRWLGIFAVVYLLLLPLGGYRNYRPLILRADVALPVVLGLVLFYGASTYYLLHHLARGRGRRWYLVAVGVFSAIFLNADKLHLSPADNNACQRQALERLARSPAGVVHLPQQCPVLAWTPIRDYRESRYQARLLHYWGITWGLTRYDQPADPPR